MPDCPNCKNSIETETETCPSCGAGAAQDEKITMFTALNKYSQFCGRASRKEFWLWILFANVVSFLVQVIVGVLFYIFAPEYLSVVLSIAFCAMNALFFIPTVTVLTRRLHDIDRNGWNFFWVLLPIIGWIILLIYECQDSQPGENQYGPNPKGC